MIWKQSPTFPDYEISEHGDVRRLCPDRVGRFSGKLRKSRMDRGYRKLHLFRNGKPFFVRVSRLVAEAFIGPPPFEGAQACHCEGNSSHDHYSNLRWDTAKENFADTLLHGTRPRGESHGNVKLHLNLMFRGGISVRLRAGNGGIICHDQGHRNRGKVPA